MNIKFEKEEIRNKKANSQLNSTKSETSMFGVGVSNNEGSLAPSESIRNDVIVACCCCISYNCGGAVMKKNLKPAL